MRVRVAIALFLGSLLLAWAANPVRLYLKEGGYQMVREYEVLKDRVRYYSTERGDWEEIPLDLVDLAKTRSEQAKIDEVRAKDAADNEAEDKAEREAAREMERVPVDPGVYWVDGNESKALKAAEMKVNTSKRRQVLKALSPLPLVPGKATVEIDGTQSTMRLPPGRPEFYIRVATEEPFTIVRLTPQKLVRIVERVAVIPVTNEYLETRDAVEIFKRQVAEGLFKLWPQKPLEPGEYAVIQYDDGKVKMQVWDFAIGGPPAAGSTPEPAEPRKPSAKKPSAPK